MNKKGLTIIEVIVVILIIGIISGGIFSIMIYSLRERKKGTERLSTIQQLAILVKYLREDMIKAEDIIRGHNQITFKLIDEETGEFKYVTYKIEEEGNLAWFLRDDGKYVKELGKGALTEITFQKFQDIDIYQLILKTLKTPENPIQKTYQVLLAPLGLKNKDKNPLWNKITENE